MSTVDRVIKTARSQVGVHEGRSGGHWNNDQKYSKQVPGLEWSNHQPWCATFVAWVALKAGAASLFPRTASTDLGASWFKQRNRWSEYPAIGAQVFYGHNGDMNHTGIVYNYDHTYVYTIEGNTNSSGSREGDGVYLKKRVRRDDYVQGYGYPDYPEGIKSADPKWRDKAPAKPKRKPAKKKPTVSLKRVQRLASRRAWARLFGPIDRRHGAIVKAALKREGFGSYAAFQKSLGYRGKDANGIPGRASLKVLGRRQGFRVVA